MSSRLAGHISVFLSYSHRDETLLHAFKSHLALLKRQGLVATWHDRRIDAGQELSHGQAIGAS